LPTEAYLSFGLKKFRVSASQIALTSSLLMSGPQFSQPQFTGLSGLGAMLQESIHKLQQKQKTVREFKYELLLI